MILVTIYKNQNGYIGFEAEGHAEYSESGTDIICAAVSVLMTNTANSIEALTNDTIVDSSEIGYLPCAAFIGLIADRAKKRWLIVFAMIGGTAVLYALGTVWFMIQTQRSLAESLMLCVVPFLLGDAAKIAVASAIGIPLRSRIDKWLEKPVQNK